MITKNLRPGLLAWATGATYKVGDRRSNGGNAYHVISITSGVSGATGPTGTGSSIVDGGVTWKWTSTFDASDIYAFMTLIVGPVTDSYDMVIWNDNEILCFWSNPGVVSCTGHGTTATNTIRFRCAPGESFADNPTNPLYPDPAKGVCITRGPNHDQFWVFQENYGSIDGIQMRRRNDTSSLNATLSLSGNIDLTRMLIRSYNNQQPNNGPIGSGFGGTVTMTNCTLIDYQPGGNNSPVFNTASGDLVCTNCTLVTLNASVDAFHRNYSGSNTITNCNIFGWTGIGNANLTAGLARNNVVDWASYPTGWTDTGAATLFSKNVDNQFTRRDGDYRLKGGADAINAGYTDTTHLPTAVDVFGTARPQGSAWDVGPHEWAKAPVLADIGTGGAALGRHYSNIETWLAALPPNLVTDGNSYVGQCFNDGLLTTSASIHVSGFTTDATHTITLTTAAGQSFMDNPNKLTVPLRWDPSYGVALQSAITHDAIISCANDYFNISNIQIRGNGWPTSGFFTYGWNNTIRNCIIQMDAQRNGGPALYIQSGCKASNILAVCMQGGDGFGVQSGSSLVNCTAVSPTDKPAGNNGIWVNYTGNIVRNFASFGFANNGVTGSVAADGHNCVDTTTVPGTVGNITSAVYANQFVSTISTAQDWRLKTTSACIDAGVDCTSLMPTAADIVGTTRPQGVAWDIGAWEAAPLVVVPAPDFFDLYAEVAYRRTLRRPYHIRRVVAPPPQPPILPGIKTFYVTNTAGSSAGNNNWWSLLQEGGPAPTPAAVSPYGWTVAKGAFNLFWRARLGATAFVASGNGQAGSQIDSTSGPTLGTGSGATTAGDSFRSPVAYNGSFPAGNWVFTWALRVTTASAQGSIRTRVWASANANGSSARALTSTTQVGANTGSMSSTSTTYNSNVTWAAPAITLNNEYLFIQVEWQELTAAGSSNSSALGFYQSAASIVTTLFTPLLVATGNLLRNQDHQTINAAGDVPVTGIIGTLAITQADHGINAAGNVPATGTLTRTQADHGINAAGTVTTPSTGRLVTGYFPGTARANYDGIVGVSFIPTANITFNRIGLRSGGASGFSGRRQVYVFDNANPGTLLANWAIDLTGTTSGTTYYSAMVPITLASGTRYELETRTANDSTHFWPDAGFVTMRSDVGSISSASGQLYNAQAHNFANQMFYGLDLDNDPALTYTRITPVNMTGPNTPSPYVVTSISAYPGGYEPWRSFDGDPNTLSHSANSLSTEAYWIKIDLGSAQYGSIYRYTPRNDNALGQWSTWVLEGSNNDSTWTTVDTITSEPAFDAGIWRGYVCANPGTYRYWRWTVTAANGNNFAAAAALELWGTQQPITGTLSRTQADNTVSGWVTYPNALTTYFKFAGGVTLLNGHAGVKFQPASNMDFNRIGLRAYSGQTGLRTVRLYNYDTQALLQSASVDMTGSTVGNFYYTSMPTTTLVAGTNYAVEAVVASSDTFGSACPVTLRNTVAGQTVAVFFDTVWHTQVADAEYYGVDLDYVSALPTITGTLNLTQDNNTLAGWATYPTALVTSLGTGNNTTGFTGEVGVKLQSSANTDYNRIGMTALVGATGSHTVKLYNYDTKVAVQTVTIDLTGSTAGNFYYTTIPTTTLVNGVNYAIMAAVTSSETFQSNRAVTMRNTVSVQTTGVYYDGTWHTAFAGEYYGLDLYYVEPPIAGTLNLAQEANALGAAGKVDIAATLNQTQAQTINAAGVIGAAPAIGGLNLPQAPNTLSAVGGVVVGGTLARTQADQTLLAAGGAVIGGALARTQADQTINAAGTVLVGGTLNLPQAPETLVAVGGPVAGGALARPQDPQTINAAGKVVVAGTLNKTQDQTLNATGSVLTGVGGALVKPQDPQTINAAGNVPLAISGTLNLPQAPETIVATGGPVAGAALSLPQANQTIISAGKVDIGGTLSRTQADQTLSAQGKVLVGGALALPQDPNTITATGGPVVKGTLSLPQDPQTLLAAGTVPVAPATGTLVKPQDPQTINAGGVVLTGITATLNRTQANQTIGAAGGLVIGATLNRTQANQGISATGGPVLAATLARTQADQTISAVGKIIVTGALARTQADQTILAIGGPRIAGALNLPDDPDTFFGTVQVGAAQARVIMMA